MENHETTVVTKGLRPAPVLPHPRSVRSRGPAPRDRNQFCLSCFYVVDEHVSAAWSDSSGEESCLRADILVSGYEVIGLALEGDETAVAAERRNTRSRVSRLTRARARDQQRFLPIQVAHVDLETDRDPAVTASVVGHVGGVACKRHDTTVVADRDVVSDGPSDPDAPAAGVPSEVTETSSVVPFLRSRKYILSRGAWSFD